MKALASVTPLLDLKGRMKTLTASFTAATVLLPMALFAQEGGDEAVVHEESLMDLFREGGIVMWFLAISSIMLVWLTVDLWMRSNRKKMAPTGDVLEVQELFRAGDYVAAYQYCKNNPSPFCDVTRTSLSFAGDGQEATEGAIYAELGRVNSMMQTRINYLSVIGVCTPMIGLIGTVIGMKGAFKTLGSSGVGDPSKLSGAIGEVLVATASGLFIAVPAFLLFYILRNKLQGSIHALQDIVVALFRKMPYEHMAGAHVGEEEFYAAVPNWVAGSAAAAAVVNDDDDAVVAVASAD